MVLIADLMWNIFFKFVLFSVVLMNCETANILITIPYAGRSHYIMQRPIGLELARRGHNVTVVTPIYEHDVPSNYRQIKVSDKKLWDVLGLIKALKCIQSKDLNILSMSNNFCTERPNLFQMVDMSSEKFHRDFLWKGGLAVTEMTLNNTEVQRFLATNQTFDLVISEQFHQEATYILAYKYNAPLVLISTFGSCFKHNMATRNPLQLATLHFEFFKLEDPTSFMGRFKNLYFSLYEYMWWRYWFLNKHEKLIHKYIPDLPKPVPSLYDVQRNVSLFLMNTHFSYDPPAAYLPNTIEIGGIHLTENVSPLPEDIQKILDEAENGAVYVNFGSNILSKELPVEKKNTFINVFRRLNHTVLWKWEDEILINKPDNVFVRKWLPQNDILSHPNVKVFVSHGGLIGTLEAVNHGVPIIGIPVYGDQYNNLLQMEYAGSGKILLYHDINEENFESALQEFLENSCYRIKAKELQIQFKDRPMKALDTAMFWIEYVIRHKGAGYMKNPALKLSWVAYNMLDVYAFISIMVLVCLYVLYRIIKVFIIYKYSMVLLISPINMNCSEAKIKKYK